jgi:hypothetical protein
MGTDIPVIVQTGGPWLLLLGTIVSGLYAILSGQLVPRATLDVLTAQWEARLVESHKREQDWREAYRLEVEARDAQDDMLGRLVAYAETADRVIQSLPTGDDHL